MEDGERPGDRRRSDPWLRRILWLLPCTLFAVVACIHLGAPPDHPGEDFTPTHRIGAAAGNLLGPWGVLAVRSVGFPNRDRAGFPVFEPIPAVLLTGALVLVVAASIRARRTITRALCLAAYVPLILLWFGIGLLWIAGGRL